MSLKKIWIDTKEDYSSVKRKWKRGYNKEIDAVCISKDGTCGKVVEIDGLRIALPAPPKNKRNILNSRKAKENQVWERSPIPEDLEWIDESSQYDTQSPEFRKKWDEYISNEWDRRINGLWVMIDGEEVYLTGRNYMFLQWNSIGYNRYPKYRYSQMVLWTHWEACLADNRCFGQCYLKNRRSGYSTMNMSDSIDYASQTEGVNVGIMSKTSKDASKMYGNMLVPAFQNYPFFFKTLVDGNTNPKAELALREPSSRITKTNRVMKKGKGLNSVVTHWTTALNSMDGMAIHKMALDEIGKFPKEVPFNDYWQVAMECLTEGGDIVGKVMAGSTANSSKKGGAEFKDIYYDSKIETRDDIGQTKSGMYSLFIPAEYNLSRFIDKYGKPILDVKEGSVVENEKGEMIDIGSIKFLKARRDRYVNDPEKLNEELRKNPSTEEHAFRDPSTDSNFNLTKIYEQLDLNASMKTSEVVRGRFEWLKKYESAVFVPDPNGKVIQSWLPPRGMRNRSYEDRGKKSPGNEQFIVGGIDSYDIGKTVDGRGSNGSMHIFLKNGLDEDHYNKFVCEYVDRPATAEDFYENCIKIMVYYGAKILIENNKPRILYYMLNNGFREYSANRPDRSFSALSRTERLLGGIPNSSLDVKLWHAESIGTYIERYVGINRNEEFGRIGTSGNCYFDELLSDWASFDINNRTEYDRSISSGLALMLANKAERKPIDHESRKSHTYVRKFKVNTRKR